jgi:hypothetical protein
MRHLHSRVTAIASVLGLGLAALGASGCGLNLSLSAEARNTWERDYTLAPDGTFEIRSPNGTIELATGEGDAVTVRAERIVNAASDEAAEQALAAFEIAEEVSPDRIVIDSGQRDNGVTFNLSRKVEYRVTVPRWANVKLTGSNGTIDAEGVEGRFEASVTNGRVTAQGLGGPASVTSTNGTIALTMARLGGDIACETTNGAITLMLPDDAGAELEARVTNGRISHEGLDVKVIEESRRRLDATIGAGGPRIRLETTNGAVRVRRAGQ